MRFITTLLALLLTSSVFAETWICSSVDDNGENFNDTFIRTSNGFDQPRDGGLLMFAWETIHEDESVLVLHTTTSGNAVGAYFYTSITQIEKNGEKRFIQTIISPMNTVQLITKGQCEVLE
ncbi:MAG: hypothetical protein P8M36_07665 [Gammaproteobacteria bacterium]|nr:hypothetical protein [Gammaproteobacteria bacterium]